MKIVAIEYFILEFPLAVPYTIAYETVSHTTNVILKIVADNGLVGWGCAAPDEVVTGERPDQVVKNIKEVVEPLLKGESPFQITFFNEYLKKEIPHQSSTIAMVDMALLDLLARKAKLPLYQMIGGFRKSIATSITIGILPLRETIEFAKKHLANGFSILKLKGGIELEEDIEKIGTLRRKFGHNFLLRFDANQGYTLQQSIDFIKRTKQHKIEIFEQPSHQKQDTILGEITHAVKVPVMADESVKTLKDAFHLVSNNYIDMVNIKLMKMGGITESQHINSISRAAGMEVMVGCLDECALGISAGLHFALSRPNIEFADLDGHLDLLNDPFLNLFTLKNGILYPSNDAGLGKILLS